MEPLFEQTFVASSYANRRGKGTHRALDHIQRLCRRFPYVLQCDVRQFFPSLDHAVLRAAFAKRITDQRVRRLVDLILASGDGLIGDAHAPVFFPGDDLFATLRPRGLPIGNLTSQFWANVYLNEFDHFVTRGLRCVGYVRYVDDLVLFDEEKGGLWRWKAAVVDRLARLRLTLHAGSHPRPVTEGVPILGWLVFPDRRRLKRRKGVHFRRKLRRAVRAHKDGELALDRVTASVRGWVNHTRYGNTTGLRKAVFRDVVVRPPHQSRESNRTGI